jgi:hypothetical protein
LKNPEKKLFFAAQIEKIKKEHLSKNKWANFLPYWSLLPV